MANKNIVIFNSSIKALETPHIGDIVIVAAPVSITGGLTVGGSVTIGGITRNTWPTASNATQALTGVLSNGSVGNIPLAGKFQIKNSTGITTYLSVDEATGVASVSDNAGGLSKILSAVDKDVALGVAGLDANTKVIQNPASLETANGVAGLDVNIEVIKPQAGAAAQVALGRTGSRKRADGTWDGVNILLPNGYDLHLWSDGLVSGQIYNVPNPANAPSLGWWYVEILRHSSDIISNQYRTLRLTAMVSTAYPNGTIFTSSDALGTWSAWEKFNIGGGSGWLPVTLLNGNTKLATEHFGIRKTPDGTVTVAGIIRTPVSGALFNIPNGYIPNVMTPGATNLYEPAQDSLGGGAYSYLSLNSASFNISQSVTANWIMISHSWQVI